MNYGQSLSRYLAIVLVCVLGGLAAVACTVVRYPPPDDADGGGTGPAFATIDMLVLVDLNRSTSNLTPKYGEILGSILAGLEQQNIVVRGAAMAPLHRRTGQVVPLIYGEDDPDAEFDNFGQAIAFFAQDDGLGYLPDTATGEAENLALLGDQLDERAIYHPTTADPSAAAYFGPAADGLLVVILSASDRLCGIEDPDCQIDGELAYEHVTERSDGGSAWLEMAGETSLPPERIYYAPIVTAEGVGYEEFYSGCTELPNFPNALIDVMEPGSEAFWGPFVDGVVDGGGRGEVIDMCEAMSSRGPVVLGSIVANVRLML